MIRLHTRALALSAASLAAALGLALTLSSAEGRASGTRMHAYNSVFDYTPDTRAAQSYVPGEVVVGYGPGSLAHAALARATRLSRSRPVPVDPGSAVLRLPPEVSVPQAIAQLQGAPGVRYAVPNYVAHIAGPFIPDDPGQSGSPGGWQQMQWNFLPGSGVDAPTAWGNLIADHRPGGRGVVVAVLDTGVAYRNWRRYARSPDLKGTRFVAPYDFVANNPFPLDREGHGTFVASEIAETTNNNFGLTGLAYGASIMPVRVLDADGTGGAATIARGIRYAVKKGAQVINLSLEFGIGIRASDIPDVVDAIGFAERRGVVVVAAAGNDDAPLIAYPARVPGVIAVGATTSDRCLAWYSNTGPGISLVAPGGDDDATLPSDPDCHPNLQLPDISQMTFNNSANPRRFGYPRGVYGTSMAAPEVAATAALVIASGVIGRHPTPNAVLQRLEDTAQSIGNAPLPNEAYGYGMLNAGAATAPPAAAQRRG